MIIHAKHIPSLRLIQDPVACTKPRGIYKKRRLKEVTETHQETAGKGTESVVYACVRERE